MENEGMPWAKVRVVDLDAGVAEKCAHCDAKAILEFRVEYQRESIEILTTGEFGEAVTDDVRRESFACLDHAGRQAFGAAYEMVSGPVGGV
jgi:hypothetical protein